MTDDESPSNLNEDTKTIEKPMQTIQTQQISTPNESIFYWTHLLYLPFFVFLIIHAENFWKWIVGPLSLLLLEKIHSILTRYSSGKDKVVCTET
ncbi:unnamed protein product [Rotaria sp. Silwood2]|nr:unnamed protein product [Rotaria sp. Silwood2]